MTTLTTPPTQTTNWQDLCAQLRNGADVDVLLATYAQLDPESVKVAAAMLASYRLLNPNISIEALATITALRALTAGES